MHLARMLQITHFRPFCSLFVGNSSGDIQRCSYMHKLAYLVEILTSAVSPSHSIGSSSSPSTLVCRVLQSLNRLPDETTKIRTSASSCRYIRGSLNDNCHVVGAGEGQLQWTGGEAQVSREEEWSFPCLLTQIEYVRTVVLSPSTFWEGGERVSFHL